MKNKLITPKIYSILCLFFLIIGISACKNKSFVTKHAPQADFSTPENTVISYWKYQAWKDSLLNLDALIYYSDFLSAKPKIYQKIKVEEAKFHFRKQHFLFPNTIEKKQKLSNSEFVIYTNEPEYENDTTIYKYVLVIENNEWRISDRREKCKTCRGTGMTDGSQDEGKSEGKIECRFCRGEGWCKFSMVSHWNKIF